MPKLSMKIKKLSAYSSLEHLWATAVGNFSLDVSRSIKTFRNSVYEFAYLHDFH